MSSFRIILRCVHLISIAALESDLGFLILNYPLPDDVLRDAFEVSFMVNFSQPIFLLDNPLGSYSTIVFWDDITTHHLSLSACSLANLCKFNVSVRPADDFGPHMLTLVFTHQDQNSLVSDNLDQIQIEVVYAAAHVDESSPAYIEPADALPPDPWPDAEFPAKIQILWKINFLSPRNLSSFVDPNNINISFNWYPATDHAAADGEALEARLDVAGFGTVATSTRNATACAGTSTAAAPRRASGAAAGGHCSFTLRGLPPGEYAARASLWLPEPRASAPPAAAADVMFHVWPDHSWVTATTAHGAGLTRAVAGEPASFGIRARDWRGAPAEGAWFVARLVGPAVVVPRVEERGGGSYAATYMAVRPPRADLDPPARAARCVGWLGEATFGAGEVECVWGLGAGGCAG